MMASMDGGLMNDLNASAPAAVAPLEDDEALADEADNAPMLGEE